MAMRNALDRPQRLFFYGTLTHEHDNPATRAVLPLLRCLGRASMRGALHVIHDPGGWYPVLTPGQCRSNSPSNSQARVWGWLYEAGPGFGRAALQELDNWEWFAPRRPFASEFVRRQVHVTCGKRLIGAQAYCFNRAVHPGLRAVPGGDFSAFIARRSNASRSSAAFGAAFGPHSGPAITLPAARC